MNNPPPVLWQNLTWEDVAALRDRGITMAILPVGATEQHGPHLPLGVDTLSAEAVAHGASALTGIPVLPSLAYGCSLGHSPKWPGTISLRPRRCRSWCWKSPSGSTAPASTACCC
jgi:creatinine amidohydrolase